MPRRMVLMAAVALVFPQIAAMAHRLDAEFVPTEQGFRIEFFMGDGSPGADLSVTAQREGGEPIEIGRTDAKGVIAFIPPQAGEWTIVGKGGGHSTSRNPLVIKVDRTGGRSGGNDIAYLQAATAPASASGAKAVTQPSVESAGSSDVPGGAVRSSKRGRFPWMEVAVSFGFIALLTAVTLGMMRLSTRFAGRPSEVDVLAHEMEHLRATIRQLRQENAELKGDREHRA